MSIAITLSFVTSTRRLVTIRVVRGRRSERESHTALTRLHCGHCSVVWPSRCGWRCAPLLHTSSHEIGERICLIFPAFLTLYTTSEVACSSPIAPCHLAITLWPRSLLGRPLNVHLHLSAPNSPYCQLFYSLILHAGRCANVASPAGTKIRQTTRRLFTGLLPTAKTLLATFWSWSFPPPITLARVEFKGYASFDCITSYAKIVH